MNLLLSVIIIGLGCLEIFVVVDHQHLLDAPGGGVMLGMLTVVGIFSIYTGCNAIYEDFFE